MKIIIVGNFPTNEINMKFKGRPMYKEGWVAAYLGYLSAHNEVYYIFPQDIDEQGIACIMGQITYIGFYRKLKPVWRYDASLEQSLENCIKKIGDFDILHIMGTEYGHSLAMANVARKNGFTKKCIISIQGLISIIAEHYCDDIPFTVQHRWCGGDIFKLSNLSIAKKFFELRGKNERKTIRTIKRVIGRTDFDYACTKQIDREVDYHYCGEILRSSFYSNTWNIDKCIKNTIFMSQGNYPIKGLHYAVKALKIVKEFVPDVMLKLTGRDLLKAKRLNSYEKFIKQMIIKYNCQKSILFLGNLSEDEMAEQYRNANVFISPSCIENSSNSIGEAMITGTPIVASDVGGTSSLIIHKREGLLYSPKEYYLLADYILKVLLDKDFAMKISENEKKKAFELYEPERVMCDAEKIYTLISNEI